mmetsp:Transcript_17131/g.42136  ORF Transcript_17131/g.42136 Transcript_17131/m.42136 type:complete len:230 (-) Transcript_17131:432-1121(-)
MLSSSMTSPWRQGTATASSANTRAMASMARAGISRPLPNTTERPGALSSSRHPWCAARIWLKKTSLGAACREPATRMAGSTGDECRTVSPPPSSHCSSSTSPLPRATFCSSSSGVRTPKAAAQPRPMAEDARSSLRITRLYLTPNTSRSCMNAGSSSNSLVYTRCESSSGVAPPEAAGTSQKNSTRSGKCADCASSWWKGMGRSGGLSLAVNTRSPITLRRTALPPEPS